MARKNRRRETYVPLDLTPDEIPTPPPPKKIPTGDGYFRHEHFDRERWRAERQRNARMAKGIDWTICLVPGCGGPLTPWGQPLHRANRRDPALELPLCFQHQAVVWQMCVNFHLKNDRFIEAIADVNDRLAERIDAEEEQQARAFADRQDGEIYFVRLGDLVKVGWTRDLWSRLKSYGASAQLLVSYPATRDDETTLHRQLRPALAKGREWYHDGDVINHFIAEALEKYGPPVQFEGLWTEPKQIVAGKRHR